MKNNKKWFSLPLAIWLVIIISLLALSILEYIVPFSKDIKWVENGAKAYYQANSWVEEWLYHIYTRADEVAEKYKVFSWNASLEYKTISSGSLLPPAWEWNSEYDNDWNTISSWNPIQLSIWNWYVNDWSMVDVYFRVPDLDRDWASGDKALSWGTLPIINWQLSADNNTLNASWSIITSNDICSSNESSCDFLILYDSQWVDLNWNEWPDQKFDKFYEDNCDWTSSWCTLKFSIINKLETDDTTPISIPYLEWKIDTDTNVIPLRYTKVEASGKAYGYKKNLEVKVATQTVNEAFDFTVFQ